MKDALRLIIRTEGGPQIGLGHVRRCLSLAVALRERGVEVFFLANDDSIVVRQVVASGFEVIRVKPEADPSEVIEQSRKHGARVIVVDSYSFQKDHFAALMQAGPFVVALDDGGRLELPVHMVINGSVGAEQLAYRGLSNTSFVLGPQYILLRPEFAEVPSRTVADRVERVLITVGGSDPRNLTPRLIRWSCSALPERDVDVLVGPLFENLEEITQAKREQENRITLHHDPQDLTNLLLAADLAICGGGQTTYELAATGTPALAIRLWENQTWNLRGFSESGALIWVGDAEDAELEVKLKDNLSALAAAPDQRTLMSARGRSLVDGQGALRTAGAILDLASDC